MNVLYEEEGAPKAALMIHAPTAGSAQPDSQWVETPHGKRVKVKTSHVLLTFEKPAAVELMPRAQELLATLDVAFLWECAGTDEFAFTDLAREYFGHPPDAVESTAMLLLLNGAGMYFVRRGRGRYQAATAAAIEQAKAAAAKKQQQNDRVAAWAGELAEGRLPKELAAKLPSLIYKPLPSWPETKAVEQAAKALHTSPARLLIRCGAVPSTRDYHLGRFLSEHFPKGRDFPLVPPFDAEPALETAAVAAFSIDDTTTTEIDDAFSVTRLPDGTARVGIHIAAPALGFPPESPLDELAQRRMSTVYLPGDKITMLPEAVIAAYSLDEGRSCPAMSLYLHVDESGRILSSDTRVERVPIAKNLRYPDFDELATEAAFLAAPPETPFIDELRLLYSVAEKLEAQRGKSEPPDKVEFLFYVENERIRIVPRRRGPIDKIVAELMIHVNSSWGRLLGDRDVRALYRTQEGGKVRLSLYPAPHQSLGVAQYLWASSPLRRYADLLNQWQLLSVVYDEPSPYAGRDEAILTVLRDFESAHAAYDEFQRTMERYYSLRYLLQEGLADAPVHGVVIRDSLVRLEKVPLFQRVPSLPECPPGAVVALSLSHIDDLELTLHCEFRERIS